MSLFQSFRSTGRGDLISEREKRMAQVTARFHEVIGELGPAIAQAEALVERLQDIRQEAETYHLMEEVARHVEEVQAQEAPPQA